MMLMSPYLSIGACSKQQEATRSQGGARAAQNKGKALALLSTTTNRQDRLQRCPTLLLLLFHPCLLLLLLQ